MESPTRLVTYLIVYRIFALTYLNRLVAVSFASITLVQFIIGFIVASTWNKSGTCYLIYVHLTHGYTHADQSKLNLNYTCTITLNLNLELVYFALSLFFGGKTLLHYNRD